MQGHIRIDTQIYTHIHQIRLRCIKNKLICNSDALGRNGSSVGQDDNEVRSVQHTIFRPCSPINLHPRGRTYTQL